MNALSGVSHSGFDQSDLLAKISERFEAADLDKSGTLTKAELSEFRSAKGLDTSKIDKIFDWLDTDGDSVVNLQEQEDRLLAMAERLGSGPRHHDHASPGGRARIDAHSRVDGRSTTDVSGSREVFGALKGLLESIEPSTAGSDQIEQMKELSQKISAEGFSEENLSALVAFLTSLVPPIDSTV